VPAPVSEREDSGCEIHEEDQLAAGILSYLADHPHAMDSAEGIAEFWLTQTKVRVVRQVLEKVLRRLTGSGVLEEVGRAPACFYRLKPPARGKRGTDHLM
jgi:hypothetical protein